MASSWLYYLLESFSSAILQEKSFENSVGKEEIANYISLFSSNLKLSSAHSLSLGESKICHLGKGLRANEGVVNKSRTASSANWNFYYM